MPKMDTDLIEINKELEPFLEQSRLQSIANKVNKCDLIENIKDTINKYPAASNLEVFDEESRTKFKWVMNNQPYGFRISWTDQLKR